MLLALILTGHLEGNGERETVRRGAGEIYLIAQCPIPVTNSHFNSILKVYLHKKVFTENLDI